MTLSVGTEMNLPWGSQLLVSASVRRAATASIATELGGWIHRV